jgi:Tol biopolymer transport system component
VYSQDGSKIVYVVVERTGKNADDYLEYIYIMNADGSDQQQIANCGKINEMYVITSNK